MPGSMVAMQTAPTLAASSAQLFPSISNVASVAAPKAVGLMGKIGGSLFAAKAGVAASKFGAIAGKGLGMLGGGNPWLGAATLGASVFSAIGKGKAREKRLGVLADEGTDLEEARALEEKFHGQMVGLAQDETDTQIDQLGVGESIRREDISEANIGASAATKMAYSGATAQKTAQALERSETSYGQQVDTAFTGLGKKLMAFDQDIGAKRAAFDVEGKRIAAETSDLKDQSFITDLLGGFA